MNTIQTSCSACGEEYSVAEPADFEDDLLCPECKGGNVRSKIPFGGTARVADYLHVPADGNLNDDRCCYCGETAKKTVTLQDIASKSNSQRNRDKRVGICQKHCWYRIGEKTLVFVYFVGLAADIFFSSKISTQTKLVCWALFVALLSVLKLLFRLPRIQVDSYETDESITIISGLGKEYLDLFPERPQEPTESPGEGTEGLQAGVSNQRRSSCTVCGQLQNPGDFAAFGTDHVCLDCKPHYVQCIREGVPTQTLTIRRNSYRDDEHLFTFCDGDLVLDKCCLCGGTATETISIRVPWPKGRIFNQPKKKVGVCGWHKWYPLWRTACAWMMLAMIPVTVFLWKFVAFVPWLALLMVCLPILGLLALGPHLIGTHHITAFCTDGKHVKITGLGKGYLSLFLEQSAEGKDGVSS